MSDLLQILEDGILTLTINRPEAHNAISRSVTLPMREAVIEAETNSDVRCIVVTGAGGLFSAGGDINEQASGEHISKFNTSPEEAQRQLIKEARESAEVSRLLHQIPKPTLAIIPGAAAGAGFAITLACDMRFCLDTAKLTTAFAKVGLAGDSGGTYFLPHLVGAAKAMELYFSADVISGREAYDMGLVTKIASKENFEEESHAYAKYLANLPTKAIGYIKQNIQAAYSNRLEEAFDIEAENLIRSMLTEDHQRAAKAFINKKTVVFEGR